MIGGLIQGNIMTTYEFEYFNALHMELYAPTNEAAKSFCKQLKRKNLIEDQIEYLATQDGNEVILKPKMKLKESIKMLVKHELS